MDRNRLRTTRIASVPATSICSLQNSYWQIGSTPSAKRNSRRFLQSHIDQTARHPTIISILETEIPGRASEERTIPRRVVPRHGPTVWQEVARAWRQPTRLTPQPQGSKIYG